MIATNESKEDGGRYVEVVDLINPKFVRKFIDLRVALIDCIGGGGLLQNQPGELKYHSGPKNLKRSRPKNS